MVDEYSDEVVRSVRKLAFAMDQLDPFPAAVISEPTLRRLVDAGLAEAGRSCRPAVGSVGYRLTDRGWRIARENWTRPTGPYLSGEGIGPT
jgi:hypothetical protein